MPRGSFNPENAIAGGGFTVEGNFEVVKSYIGVVQLPPNKAGVQSDPFPALCWEGYKLDENWARVDGGELVHANFRIGKLEDFRPGNLQNPDDLNEEPEDLGREVDTQGNALFTEQGKSLYKDSAFIMLTDSLLRPGGFKPAVINKGYAPDFEGMKLHLKIANMRTYKDKEGQEKTPTTSVCDKAIAVYPYDKPKSKAGKAGAGAGKVVGTVAVTGKQVQAPVGAPGQGTARTANGDDPMLIAAGVIGNRSDRFKKMFPADKAVKRGVLQMQFNMELMAQKVDKALHPALMDIVKTDESLMELGGNCGFMFDPDAGTVTFPGE